MAIFPPSYPSPRKIQNTVIIYRHYCAWGYLGKHPFFCLETCAILMCEYNIQSVYKVKTK